MYVTYEQMCEINRVQVGILKEVARVCEMLDIRFFMVHGSLLGTIRCGGFVPYDDDIDIAMHRADYERFLSQGPALMDRRFFIQSAATEENYPLSFAKVRDSATTYVCEAVKDIRMNHGVYIDIFPLDNAESHPAKLRKIRMKLLNFRISSALSQKRRGLAYRAKSVLTRILYPSVRKAVLKRELLQKACRWSGMLCMTGGKPTEHAMPAEWFATGEERRFEGIRVHIPVEYDSYLRRIYGHYEERTLVEGKMLDGKVELNACVVDTQRPYTQYR